MLTVAPLIALAVIAASIALGRADGERPVRPYDALHAETFAELEVFTDWLERHGVAGYIGEVGWPDDARGDAADWNRLAAAWFERADRAGLWVTVWATGTWFGPSYPLSIYDHEQAGLTPSDQAAIVERPTPMGARRGVTVAGGEFGVQSASFSNVEPGIYGEAYRFDPPETFRYLAGRGHELVRLPFRWERAQPQLGGPLDAAEMGRIRKAVADAHAAGLAVVLDLHNFGEYRTRGGAERLGSEIAPAEFADTWRRLALAFGDVPGIAGYGLMNEPVHVRPGAYGTAERSWERASQAAVTAIRSTGDRRLVLVSGYPWSSVHDWPAHHPRPWITDPARNVRYEAHHYWDADRSGTYDATYAEERAVANRR